MEEERIINTKDQPEEQAFELSLRPKTLLEFVGQEKIKENLSIFLEAAKKRKEPLEHVLLYGNPGLGKTTLAHIIASEMTSQIRVTSGPAIERAGDLAAILSNMQPGDILFVDEIHRLNKTVEEMLYPAMEDFALDIVIGKGPAARTLRLDLPKFTIIGATTRLSLLSSPLRDRFGNILHLSFYEQHEIEKVLERSSKILGIPMSSDACLEIAKCARRTPRVANRILKRARDYCEVKSHGMLEKENTLEALRLLAIDSLGLDEVDRKILQMIIEKFNGGPVGLQTMAAASGEDIATIEEVYEPFLIQMGLLDRTPRGRTATRLAYEHLGFNIPSSAPLPYNNASLFDQT